MLFPAQHIERWAFDVELLFLAALAGAQGGGGAFCGPVREVAVQWSEIDGSKLDVVSDSLKMARDLLLIRFCYLTGLWTARGEAGAAATGEEQKKKGH